MNEKIMLYYTKLCKLISIITWSRKIRNKKIKSILAPYDFSILCNNCIGGVFLHDAGKRFNSPLINLSTNGEGFIKILENPHAFINGTEEFKEYNNPSIKHPHGILNGVIFNFVHYQTFDEAVTKWRNRSHRFLWDNIYVIATGHDGLECSELMERFDKLPYENKIMFTFNKWNYPWAHQVRSIHGIIRPFTEIASLTGKRFYETAFDIASWIKECEESKSTMIK